MAVNKAYKIPRNILAEMTNNNPQAIAALENSQDMAERTPQQMEDILIRIEGAASQAEQAIIIATQLTAIAQQLIADIRPTLNAVSVPLELSDTMQAVNVSIDSYHSLQPVQVTP